MTIEQLAEEATDGENFSREGDVVVIVDPTETRLQVTGAVYDEETKQLILRATRKE